MAPAQSRLEQLPEGFNIMTAIGRLPGGSAPCKDVLELLVGEALLLVFRAGAAESPALEAVRFAFREDPPLQGMGLRPLAQPACTSSRRACISQEIQTWSSRLHLVELAV